MPRPLKIACLLLLAAPFVLALSGVAAEPTGNQDDNPPTAGPASSKPRPKHTTPSERAAARKTAREATAKLRSSGPKKKSERNREAWLARLKARDIEPWPENETDEEHAAALKKSRELVDEVLSLFPGTKLIETEHFLFVTNIPAEQVQPLVASLDRMYDWMCQLYGVPRKHKVWLGGKAPIFAFLEHSEFDAFEDRFFPDARQSLRTLANVYGLSHLSTSGEVVIACFRGNDPNDFGQMLVHETSHGFVHRYKTKARLPNWIDEGMADLTGAEMVPASAAVKNRELRAAQQIAQQQSLDGMLTAERIEPWQYGVASSLNRFLLQSNRDSYVQFIEALKEGQKWDEALQNSYKSTPEELLAAYGQLLNVPNLRP